MRIDQFVPSFVKYDAISNHVLQIRSALRSAGYDSQIFYEAVDRQLASQARDFRDCDAAPDPDRLILYHASTASLMARWLVDAASRGQAVALDYHNITPSRYFARWEPVAARSMDAARHELRQLAQPTTLALADSAYNESELIRMGCRDTAVCPLLIDLDDYHRAPDGKALARLQRQRDRGGNLWLFVGRIAPNKCQHDVMAAFAVYRRLFDPKARLALVGGATSLRYLRALQLMAEDLGVDEGVDLCDSAPFADLLAYFRTADVFVCLSEHEGFCVPIIEAMELGLPVVAYEAAAVPDTVREAGVLLADKDPLAVASAVDDLISDIGRRQSLIAAGQARAGEFALGVTSKRLVESLERRMSSKA